VGLARSLAQELGKKEVLVNLVNPGFMRSRMTEQLDEKIVQAHIASSPLGRDSNPEEVAEFLVYLCSDRMAQVTGQVFHWESRRNV
jgi:3-oxoacyl-[acyl-carrier protein] reductase